MTKRIAHLVLGIVVLLMAVQPKLIVHFCGDHFINLYLNQDPTAIKAGCKMEHKAHQEACGQAYTCQTKRTEATQTDGKGASEKNHNLQTVEADQAHQCPNRELTVVDVDGDDFISSQNHTHSFATEWQASIVFVLGVARYLLPQQDVAHLLYGKAPPHLPISRTGRDILLRHATFLI